MADMAIVAAVTMCAALAVTEESCVASSLRHSWLFQHLDSVREADDVAADPLHGCFAETRDHVLIFYPR